MGQKYIIVTCGTGSVTSKNIAMKIEEFLKSKNIFCKIETCKISELRSKISAQKPNVIVSATVLPDVGVPTITTTALLTGVGVDKVFGEILDILEK